MSAPERLFRIRWYADEALIDDWVAVTASTPVEAAMKVFAEVGEIWPEVVEFQKRRHPGGTAITTVTLELAATSEVMRFEVQEA